MRESVPGSQIEPSNLLKLQRLYRENRVPVDRYEQFPELLQQLTSRWNEVAKRQDSSEFLLSFMLRQRKRGKWVRLNITGRWREELPLFEDRTKTSPKLRDRERKLLCFVYRQVVLRRGHGSDRVACDPHLRKEFCQQFNRRSTRHIDDHILLAQLTKARKQGWLPKLRGSFKIRLPVVAEPPQDDPRQQYFPFYEDPSASPRIIPLHTRRDSLRDRQTDIDEAQAKILSAEQVMRHQGASAKTSFEKGLELLKIGRFDAAAERFQQATEFDAKFTDAYFQLGLALMRLPGRDDEAVTALHQAVILSPRFAEAHYALANMLMLVRRSAEAVPNWKAFLKIVKTGPQADNARKQLLRAESVCQKSNA